MADVETTERPFVEKLMVASSGLFAQHARRSPPTSAYGVDGRLLYLAAKTRDVGVFADKVFSVKSIASLDSKSEQRIANDFLLTSASDDGKLFRVALFLRLMGDNSTLAADFARTITAVRKHLQKEIDAQPEARVCIQLLVRLTSQQTRIIGDYIEKVVHEHEFIQSVELWAVAELLYDIFSHELCDTPALVTDLRELRQRYGRNVVDKLPRVLTTDVVVRHLGFPIGSVIRYDCFDPLTNACQPYFRRVVCP